MPQRSSEVRIRSNSRIPCLDGLRAFAIGGVLLGHSRGTAGFPASDWLHILGDSANLGVRIFFVISGYLITHLLLQEAQSAGYVSLKNFYIRRTFRIFPAFYFFVSSVATLSLFGIYSLSWPDLAYAASYTSNFVERRPWVLGHLWSLAVEEQFYLLWPVCIVWFGWNRAIKVAFWAVLLSPICRSAAWYMLPQYHSVVTKAFPSICDTIAIGCLLACFRSRLSKMPRYDTFVSSPVFLVVPVVVLVSNSLASHTRWDLLFGQSIRNLGIALCIDWCLRNPVSRPARFLNAGFMIWVGTLSYSLYLWQQVFLNRNSSAIYCSFPLNIILAFVLAALSFYLLERPCLRARVWLFPNSGHLARLKSHDQPDASGTTSTEKALQM